MIWFNKEIKPFESHTSLIYQNKDMIIILIYNKKLLSAQINYYENKSFLQGYGYQYPSYDIEAVLYQLVQRYMEYKEVYKSNLFYYPHEIGIILGYPLKDVIDFIRFQGKNYILCGYWKVYHDVDTACRTFEDYRKAREKALSCIMAGGRLLDMKQNGG